MGDQSSPAAIADTGPLIHLYEIGHLPLLQVIFSLISVPQAVWDEAVTSGRIPASDLEAIMVQRVSVTADQIVELTALSETAGLHRGELECLALCRSSRTNLLLTDDLAARRAGIAMGIRPVGSLGVLSERSIKGIFRCPKPRMPSNDSTASAHFSSHERLLIWLSHNFIRPNSDIEAAHNRLQFV